MTEWAIPLQAKLKYTQLFNLHDRSRSGFLSGLQCRDILLQSGLPRNILAEIWNLSDIDGDGQLTREEFILAMHLTNHVRSGQSLPTELPADLVPPSYRRTRSISATSVHSATSAGSSSVVSGNKDDDQVSQKSSSDTVASAFAAGSVLNSNSFEDKRRENFEKGRAELERRRLKIIEQQTGILKEQLVASKKQVTEAKAKIDAMRTERDTKMGLITSLEAQLQTLKERKTYLNHEELNLIAIAKDLNLVNPAQAELDQLATQAKQQSINEMKEKLGDFVKEKEEKTKELAAATKRLEESKTQLKSISETVSKTYEAYKEKVAKAKVLREQFINENKSKTVDLDSVWDEPLNAFTSSSTNNNENIDFLASSNLSPKVAEPVIEGNVFKQKIPPEPSQVKRYRALYGFEARNPDELTINPGDIIIGSEEVCEPGWISGESNGRVGLFPEAYVELLPGDQASTEEPPKNSNNFPIDEAASFQPPPDEPPPPSNLSSHSGTRYKVIYAFDARNPDELTINPGDIIIGSKEVCEPGWISGELNGRVGLFPEAYVERMGEAAQEPPEAGTLQRMSSVGSLRSKKSRSKRAEVATVIAKFRALGQEQLNLEKGQLVLIRRKTDLGWWQGEIQVKDDDDNELKLAKGRGELDNLIHELIKSESDYVGDLLLCQRAYILPLSGVFDVSDIFIKWDQLVLEHQSSLAKLSNCLESNLNYGFVLDTFLNLISSLVDLYTEVCSRQNESTRRLEAKMASDIRFKQLVNECQRNLTRLLAQQVVADTENSSSSGGAHEDLARSRSFINCKLPLTSLMLKPMQRITKYSLISERMLKVINDSGRVELRDASERLKEAAHSLCNRVNEACRLKEDNEDNKHKLDWAQAHIKQPFHTSSLDFGADQRNSLTPDLRPHQLVSCSQEPANEIIIFDSRTKCMGERRLIKSGCLTKRRSGKELVLFLFNDLLLMTQVKGLSPLRVENVFHSTRAQQSYFKLYRPPILLENLVLHSSWLIDQSVETAPMRASWGEQQLLAINFTDNSNGAIYSLLALNAQEKMLWFQELEAASMQAKEARNRCQAGVKKRSVRKSRIKKV